MDIEQLQKLGTWLGLAGADPNLKVLERGVLAAMAFSLPASSAEDLSQHASISDLVTRGLLGPAHVAREVIMNAANYEVCQLEPRTGEGSLATSPHRVA